DGSILKRYVGKLKKDSASAEASTMKNIGEEPKPYGKPDSIDVHPGHNRFTWNLRYPDKVIPGADEKTYFGADYGPLATPGSYKVRLSVGDWSQTQNLRVKIDPRVKSIGITTDDLQAQLDLNLKIRDALGKAHRIAAGIDTLRKKVKASDLSKKDKAAAINKLDNLYDSIVTSKKGSYPPPMLIDQLNYLYRMTSSADQHPGDDAYTRFRTLNKMLDHIIPKWELLRKQIDI
ncbi:MAG TPA: hypothetical protein VJ964_01580, partial [Balneolaceae bacterium]|nr:hypothetical protein [Balneolaceae bacterium]